MKLDRAGLTPQQLADLDKADAARVKLKERESEIRAHMKDERRAKHEESVMRRTKATPETAAKIARKERDSMEELLLDGVIDESQHHDLYSIGRAYRLIAAPVDMKTWVPERVDRSQGVEPIGDMVCKDRYLAWYRDLVDRGRGIAYRVCIDVALDGMSLRFIEKARIRKRHGTAKELLIEGLNAYRDIKRKTIDRRDR